MGQTKEWIINHLAERIDAEIIYHKQLEETQQQFENMETIKESKIKSIKFTDMYETKYKHEVIFENGDIGTMYRNEVNNYFREGDLVQYKISPSGRGFKVYIEKKLGRSGQAPSASNGSNPAQQNASSSKQSGSGISAPDNKEIHLIRQFGCRMAFDILTASGNVGDDPNTFADNVIDMCEKLTKYVMNGKTNNH
jgi:hypothetical protein